MIIKAANLGDFMEIQALELKNVKTSETQSFSFDRVFTDISTQEEVTVGITI
jgi:hypothetical protein